MRERHGLHPGWLAFWTFWAGYSCGAWVYGESRWIIYLGMANALGIPLWFLIDRRERGRG